MAPSIQLQKMNAEIISLLPTAIGVVLPAGIDLDSREGKAALDAALRTKVHAVRRAEAEKAERERRERERERADPLAKAYGDDDEVDELDDYFGPRKSDEDADDQGRSPIERYFEPKPKPKPR